MSEIIIRGAGSIEHSKWYTFNGYTMPWPIASLAIKPDSITLDMWLTKYVFDKSSIESLLKKGDIIQNSYFYLVIINKNTTLPKRVLFYPRDFSILESMLIQNGYQLTPIDYLPSSIRNFQNLSLFSIIISCAAICSIVAAILAFFISKK